MARRLLFWLFQNLVFLGILRSESNNATFSFFLLPCFLHLDSCDIFSFFFLWTHFSPFLFACAFLVCTYSNSNSNTLRVRLDFLSLMMPY